MLVAALLAAAVVNWAEAPPVPGQCVAPAAENVGKPGCFRAAEIRIDAAPAELWWHVREYPNVASAEAAAIGHRWAATATSHGRAWLFALGGRDERFAGGRRRARVGPLRPPAGEVVTARFMESTFTPGMRTRVHSHGGPEAFYVVDGEQCVETPSQRRKLGAGDTFVVPPGPHVQAAARGRKNITLVLYPSQSAWMTLERDWTPSQYCAR